MSMSFVSSSRERQAGRGRVVVENKSPLEAFFGMIGALPQGHDKPVKHALYNAVALFVLVVACAAAWALYIILEPFVKPLTWAVLVGSVLHPLKWSLRERFHRWFEYMEESHTPVVLGLLLVPVNIANDLSEFIGSSLVKRLKVILAACIAVPVAHVAYCYTPKIITALVWQLCVTVFWVGNFVLDNASITLVSIILLGYFSITFFAWKPENNTKFHYASIIVWLLISSCLAHQFGSLQMPVFIILEVVFFGGFASEVYNIFKEMNEAGHSITLTESLSLAFYDKTIDLDTSEETSNDERCLKDSHDLTNGKQHTNLDETGKKPTSEITEMKSSSPISKTESGSKILESKLSNSKIEEIGDVKKRKTKDPFALDLFQEKPNLSRTDSELSNTSVLITNQGIHVIQKPQDASTLSDILKPTFDKKEAKLTRSLSQPHFYNTPLLKARSKYLKMKRKLSLTDSHQSLIDPDTYGSTFYLYSVLWACVVMLFWKNVMLLPLLPIPILFYIVKHFGFYLGLWSWLHKHLSTLLDRTRQWCFDRHDALVPVPIRGLYRIADKVNVALKTMIKDSIDTVASGVVIFGLIIFLIIASIFIVIQIYAEGIMMVQMTSNVINQTVVHNPELRQLLPPTWDDTMDSLLDNAYQYGREGISKAIKNLMADVDSVKSAKLEKQVLELWDRVYQSWVFSNDVNGPQVTEDAVRTSWEAFVSDIQKSPEIFNMNGMIEFAQQNVGTLMSLLESVWSIVKGNISLVLTSFSTFLSVILGGGTAVLNFILNVVVFLTTLFYLLNCSGDLYKPVELMNNFSPSGSRLAHALEGAVNGVFTASFRMAAFYGLWTWFIHNLFGVKIIYLPSVFAMILGAVPFLGTYWACVPAVLDLWLAQDRSVEAILFACCQFLPTSVVDTAIYKEMQGGHPYLTGLAIAGGIFCLGVEGAIIGPLLLCGLYVAIDLSSTLFRESPSEERLNYRLQLQDG